MAKIDLVTGFLGSGKTTFIKEYAQYLINKGQNIGILENDFGAVNVDMMLLQDIMGDKCELEMISGGCDKETHRRRFKTKLISMGMCGYDRVIVEPSGIYDTDEFFDVLKEDPVDRWYEIDNVIAIVDGNIEENLSETADYLLASQVANAGVIVLSHGDETDDWKVKKTIDHINRALTKIKCKRQITEEMVKKGNLNFSLSDLEYIGSAGYVTESFSKMDIGDYRGFDSLFFMNEKTDPSNIKEKIKKIFADKSCGNVMRIKGFVKDRKKGWLQINANHNEISIEPADNGQEVIIVIGENLCEDRIKALL